MSEDEKSQADHIEDVISRKLKPFYWIMITFVAIYSGSQFFTISSQANFTLQQKDIIQDIENKVNKSDFDKSVKERERDYLMKLDYYKMEADEHKDLLEAFRFPERAQYVFEQINSNMRWEMNLNLSTSRGGGK